MAIALVATAPEHGGVLTEIGPAALLAACPPSALATALPYTSSTRYDSDGRVTGTIAPDPDGGDPSPIRPCATATMPPGGS